MSNKSKKTSKQVVKKVKQPGGAIRHRKILRDNIAGITKPAMIRILRRAGIKRINGLVYEEFRGILRLYLEDIIKDMIGLMQYARRRTVDKKDLEEALEVKGQYLAAGINENAKKTASLQSCNSRGKSSTKKKKDDESSKKSHRFKPGTVAAREVRHQQKDSDCLAIPKTNFERLVREIAQDYNDDTRFSAEVFGLLQLTTEDYLTKLAESARLCCTHAGRETVQPKDFQLVRAIKRR